MSTVLQAGLARDTIAGMACDAITVLEALDYQRVDLLGFSLGGRIA